MSEKILYYGEDWSDDRIFAIASIPFLDILVTEDRFYVIKLPQYASSGLGFLAGGVLGYLIGNAAEKDRRKKIRKIWVDKEKGLVSPDFRQYIYLQIPLSQIRGAIAMKGTRKIRIKEGLKNLTLKIKRNEREKLESSISKYL